MENIKSGDLIVWNRGKRIYNTLEKVFTLSMFTHVGIAVVEEDGIYVVEAIAPQVRKVRLDIRFPCLYIPMEMDFDYEHQIYLENFIGDEYSKLQAVLSIFGIYINDNQWYCSELAYNYYTTFKPELKLENDLTPTRVVDRIMSTMSYPLIPLNKE